VARYAVWRGRPDDPRTPLGWFLADAASRRLPVHAAAALMALVGALAVGVTLWALLLIPAIILHVRPDEPPKDLTPLATVPPPGPSFAVSLEIWREDAMFGQDEGIVTFVDGWLHFVGRRTEFSLRRAGAQRLDDRRTIVFADESLTFEARDGDAEFGRALSVWHRATPVPVGESVLPPREVHPSGLARAWRTLVVPFTILVPAFVLVSLFIPIHFLFIGFLGAPGLSWMRLRTLRRRAREERRALRARETA